MPSQTHYAATATLEQLKRARRENPAVRWRELLKSRTRRTRARGGEPARRLGEESQGEGARDIYGQDARADYLCASGDTGVVLLNQALEALATF